MARLLLPDIDGTLLPAGERLPSAAAIAAAQRFYNQGGRIVPVTSQTPQLLRPVADAMGFKHHGVLDGGATIYDFAKQRRNPELSNWLAADKNVHVVASLVPFIDEIYHDEYSQKHTPDTIDLREVREAPSTFAIYPAVHNEVIDEILQSIPGISFHTNAFEGKTDKSCVQVVQAGVSKHSGCALLLASEGYDLYEGEDIAAIGDGRNDQDLFRLVLDLGGRTIAMGNTSNRGLLDMADMVTLTDRQDGFALAVDAML